MSIGNKEMDIETSKSWNRKIEKGNIENENIGNEKPKQLCSGEEDNRGRGSTKDEPWLRCTGNGCSNEIEDVKRPESHFLEADIAHNAHLGKGDDLKCARSEIQEHLSNFINKRSEMRLFFAKIVVLRVVVFVFFWFFRKGTENQKFYVFFYDFLNFYEFRKILKCCSHKDFQWFFGQIMFLQWIFDTFKNLPKDRKVRPKSRFWRQKYDFLESKMFNFLSTFW